MKRLVCLCAACGAGKSTVKNYLVSHGMPEDYAVIDVDETGLNWWDYADTDFPEGYTVDGIKRAVQMSGDKNILFVSCLCPAALYDNITLPEEITETYLIGMICSDDELAARLKARDPARKCSDDDFIKSQIEYNNWFRKRSNRLPLFIDNSGQTVDETCKIIVDFIRRLEY